MKTTYTITRYGNGWTVDTSTGDSLKNYSAVFEDPDWTENERLAQAASLTDLVWSTFDNLLQDETQGGIVMDFEEDGETAPEEECETPCDTCDGSCVTEEGSEEKKEDE